MASAQTQTPEIDNVVYIKLPEFGARDPRLWFAQLEAIFESRRITSQSSRYNYVVGCLPDFVAREVSDLIYTRPSTDPYDALKAAIISRTASSDEQNLRKLLSGVDVGDKTPSQHLRHMMHLQGKHPVNDAVLKELWQQSLPIEVRKVISVIEQDSSLAKLAEVADRVHETCRQFVVSNVQQQSTSQSNLEVEFSAMKAQFTELSLQLNEVTKLIGRPQQHRRSRSRSHSRAPKHSDQPGWCYYHRRFGDRAVRCTRPCTFPTKPSNSGNAMAGQ